MDLDCILKSQACWEKSQRISFKKTIMQTLHPKRNSININPGLSGNAAEVRDRGMGRPTKKERRDIDEYKDGSESINTVGEFLVRRLMQ